MVTKVAGSLEIKTFDHHQFRLLGLLNEPSGPFFIIVCRARSLASGHLICTAIARSRGQVGD